MDGIVSINGEISPLSQAKISVLDRGFLFGDSIFEVLVGFNGVIIGLKEHLARLRRSGECIGFSVPWDDDKLGHEVLDLYKQTSFPKTYIRICITRGEGLGISHETGSYNRLIYSLPAPQSPERIYKEGIRIKGEIKPWIPRGPSIKNPFYLPSIVAMLDAKLKNFDEILWINNEQEITEASTSNIFFVGRDGSKTYVETPALESGLLSGITRHFVIDILKANHIELRESVILYDELARYDEAFLSSTIRGLAPISKIDDKTFDTLRPSAKFHKIQQLFQAWIDTQVGTHCDWNTGLRR